MTPRFQGRPVIPSRVGPAPVDHLQRTPLGKARFVRGLRGRVVSGRCLAPWTAALLHSGTRCYILESAELA